MPSSTAGEAEQVDAVTVEYRKHGRLEAPRGSEALPLRLPATACKARRVCTRARASSPPRATSVSVGRLVHRAYESDLVACGPAPAAGTIPRTASRRTAFVTPLR